MVMMLPRASFDFVVLATAALPRVPRFGLFPRFRSNCSTLHYNYLEQATILVQDCWFRSTRTIACVLTPLARLGCSLLTLELRAPTVRAYLTPHHCSFYQWLNSWSLSLSFDSLSRLRGRLHFKSRHFYLLDDDRSFAFVALVSACQATTL